MNYFENLEIKHKDYTSVYLEKGEYERCHFENCNFSSTSLEGLTFIECKFIECNFANANINQTSFKEVDFNKCKLIGLQFCDCKPFLLQFHFEDCALDYSSFANLTLKNQTFINCSMQEVDFTNTSLIASKFISCHLANAYFENTILDKADLQDSFNFTIDPEENYIQNAIFSRNNIDGLLQKYNVIIT